MIINKEDFPNIFAAMDCILDETTNVGSMSVPVREVPDRWGGYLENIENTLGKLSREERARESEPLPAHVKPNKLLDSEFYAFCNGEYHEQSAIANRSLEYTQAYVFLGDFSEDWQLTEDDDKHLPGNIVLQHRVEWLDTAAQELPQGLSPEQEVELLQLRAKIR